MKRKGKHPGVAKAGRAPEPAADVLQQGLACHRAGRLDDADRLYRSVPRRHPAHADVLHLRGLVAHQRGDDRRALSLIRQAIESQPRNAVYHYNLGEVLRAGDRCEAALEHYRRAIALKSDYADAHFNLGNALMQLERWPQAVIAYRQALRYTSGDAELHNNLGNALTAVGERDAAIEQYRAAVAAAPGYGDARFNLAGALGSAGLFDEVIATYRELIRREPDHGPAYARLSRTLHERSDLAGARACIDAWAAHAGSNTATLRDIAAAYERIDAIDAAVDCYRRILALAPDDAGACAGLGACLQRQGRFEDAVPWQEKALDLRPDLGAVYLALAGNRRFHFDAERVAAMERLADDRHADEDLRLNLRFALGGLLDRQDRFSEAFAHYQVGNRVKALRRPFEPDTFSARVERIFDVFDRDFFARRAGFGEPSERPVFIVGMPRSGTSLVEQIVASHPLAFGAGELSDIRRMVRELPSLVEGDAPFPDCVTRLEPNLAAELGRRYLGTLAARAPAAARVTDKMPFNLLWLGLIALVLPGARVVYCRRDPLDTCLSCYFQNFEDGLRFTYDLEHLGLVYRSHERIMRHWAAHLPLPVLTVDYEALVDDQAAQSRRLIEFLGLEWDERCLQFHRTERAVRTASLWQVKQPLYRSSVGRWRAYEPWLGALKDSLDAHAG